MLLQRLRDYAQTLSIPPPLYQRLPIRYILQINEHGKPLTLIDTATPTNKRGNERVAPDYTRSSGDLPLLFADHAEYTFGVPRPEKSEKDALRRHGLYRTIVEACASTTGEPAVLAVQRFLEAHQPGQRPSCPLPDPFDAREKITFEICAGEEKIYPMDLPSVQAFWATWMSRSETVSPMECLVCGEMHPPLVSLPVQIHGIPGGQATGMALISANTNAFESYGLERSHIAPICARCGHEVCLALNTLLRQRETHLTGQSLVYAFWTSQPTVFQFGSAVFDADPTEVRAFLTSPFYGKTVSFDAVQFYAVALSANNARIVMRDWVVTTLEQVQQHVQRYFRLQYIVDCFGKPRWFPLWLLVKATVRNKSHEKAALPLEEALLHFAFHGGPFPCGFLYQIVRCIRAEQTSTQPARLDIQAAQAAFLKIILLSQPDQSWRGRQEKDTPEAMEESMVELDLSCPDEAYLCGRLFAELEEIEYVAMGKISNDIVDRYFGTASSAPAAIFGSLLRRAQPHLSKLAKQKSGAFYRLDEQLQDILSRFEQKTFPHALSLLEQGRFALGYYQQKAANRRAAIAGAEKKQAAPQAALVPPSLVDR